MAKVITTIAAEDGMNFEDICSFETKNWVGIWDYAHEDFALIPKTEDLFGIVYMEYKEGRYIDLEEFDKAVFEICEEHITDVFEKTDYSIVLIKD